MVKKYYCKQTTEAFGIMERIKQYIIELDKKVQDGVDDSEYNLGMIKGALIMLEHEIENTLKNPKRKH